MTNGVQLASIDYRRAEEVRIKFTPEYNGQEPVSWTFLQWMGQPMGAWNMDDWQRICTSAQSTLWMDYSVSAWANTATQWYLNEFTAITLLNSAGFRSWCDQNNLNGVLNKYLETDGTIKPQYVTADSGAEHDHSQTMEFHTWRCDNDMVLNKQLMTMRINGAGNEWHKVAMDKSGDNLAFVNRSQSE
eukprot:1344760-Amphidinium_carterae.2